MNRQKHGDLYEIEQITDTNQNVEYLVSCITLTNNSDV